MAVTMASPDSPAGSQRLLRLGVVLPATVMVLAVVQLVRWGGVPSGAEPAFWAGVAALIAVALLLTLTGRALLSPGPAPVPAAFPGQNRWLALLLLHAGAAIGIGAFWDEVWHRSYGIPFGRDLLWRPHLLMYLGLAGVIALAGFVLLRARLLPGRTLDRLRADPAGTLLLLLGAFLLYSLPADPLWHTVYGADISAWSLPHLLLAFNFAAITLVAVALLASGSAPHPTRWTFGPVDGRYLFILLAFALALNLLLQVFATEWDGVRFVPISPRGAFWDRPEWLFPALLTGIAVLIGTVVQRAASRIGAASLTGLTALAVRLALLRTFDAQPLSADAWLLLLPPLVALDLVALVRRRPPEVWLGAVAAAAGTTLVSLPLLPGLMVYPQIDSAELMPTLLAIGLVALGSSWFATRLGSWLCSFSVAGMSPAPTRRIWLLPGIAIALIAGLVWFIAGATPPV